MSNLKTTQSASRTALLISAWFVVLFSASFKVIAQEIFHIPVSDDLKAIVILSLLVVALLLASLWQTLKPLRAFFGLFILLIAVQWVVYTRLDTIAVINKTLQNPSFKVYMPVEQSLNLVVTLVIILFLMVLKKRPGAFFLSSGDLSAPAGAVRWLGIKQGDPWNPLGWILAGCISLGTLAFLIIAGHPSPQILSRVIPYIPVILLCAALNAFNEEMTYKASFLSVLESAVGRNHSLLLMAAYFGILHFYGVPYGIIGVILAAFMGWILGKSMLETRGLFWAWFIHFWQDVWIFSFMVIGSITPGG
jgi:hypothetical protein